jgi:chromosome segregation ATPase
LTADLSQQRMQASQAKHKHQNWQNQLHDKVATLREDKKDWQSDGARVRSELSEAQANVQRQKDELAIVKNESVPFA